MLSKIYKTIAGSLVLALAFSLAPQSVSAENLVFHYENPFLSGVSGNISIDVRDGGSGITNNTTCFAYGLGSSVFNNYLSQDVGYYTGLTPSATPWSNYQIGVSDSWPGASACQIYQNSMGFQVHKASGTNPTPAGWIYGMQLAKGFDIYSQSLLKPWATSYGTDAKLRLQTYEDVHGRYATSGVVQYGQIVFNLVDMSSINDPQPRNVWWSIHTWDSRGHQAESIQRDTAGTSNLVVVTDFNGSQQYNSSHPNSQNTNGNAGCGCLWYGTYVTKTNLLNAINYARNHYGIDFSTNPNDYAINLAAVGPEMYSPSGTDGWVGEKAWEFKVLTEY